jgi:hypothetical protein
MTSSLTVVENKTKHFTSFTQHDSKYMISTNQSENLSSLFALLTVYNYSNDQKISKDVYEHNLNKAFSNFKLIEMGNIDFEKLLLLSNLDINNLISLNTKIDLDIIFPTKKDNDSYSIILQKNANFITILKSSSEYYVHDCNKTNQYKFTNKDDMVKHLITEYKLFEYTEEKDDTNFILIDKTFELYLSDISCDTDNTTLYDCPNESLNNDYPSLDSDNKIEDIVGHYLGYDFDNQFDEEIEFDAGYDSF